MAMSVTGMRRPGSMIACRRASRVSALGRTSCAASAGSPAGIASHQNTYSRAPMPATGVSTTNASRTRPTGTSRCAASPSATPPTSRPRAGRRSGQPAGRDDGRGGVHGPIVTCPEPFRGRVRGPFRGAAHQVQGAVRGPPDAARAVATVRIETWTRALPTGAAGPDPAPGSPAPDPTPAPGNAPNSFFAAVRRLGITRSDDRWIGGVSGGLGDRFGIDPLLVRGIFFATLLLGGLGLVAYGVAWALLPERRDGRIHLEEMILGRFDIALLGALAFVIVGFGRGDNWFFFWGPPGWVQALLWISVHRRHRDADRHRLQPAVLEAATAERPVRAPVRLPAATYPAATYPAERPVDRSPAPAGARRRRRSRHRPPPRPPSGLGPPRTRLHPPPRRPRAPCSRRVRSPRRVRAPRVPGSAPSVSSSR